MKKKSKYAPSKTEKKKIIRMIMPGIRGKLSISTGIFVTLVLLAATFFNYMHEGKLLEESFARETASSLKYINAIVTDMDNVRNNLLLIENMKIRIEEKQRDLKKYKKYAYKKDNSLTNRLRNLGRSFGFKVRYDYHIASYDSYYSIYLSDTQIKTIEQEIMSRLTNRDGEAITDKDFKQLQLRAHAVALCQKNIDAIEQTIDDNTAKIEESNKDKNNADKQSISRVEKENREYSAQLKKEIRNKQYAEKLFRNLLKTCFEYDFRRLEEIEIQNGNIRILTFDKAGDETYDTGSYNKDRLVQFSDLTGNEKYMNDRAEYFNSAEKILSFNKSANFEYAIGKNRFSVQYLPVYRNPATYERIKAILSDIKKNPSLWKPFLKEDMRIASAISDLSVTMKSRLDELKSKQIPPGNDREYQTLYGKYHSLLSDRERSFTKLNPYNDELSKIAAYYTTKTKALETEITVYEKQIAAIIKSKKKPEEIKTESERLQSEIAEMREQIAQYRDDLAANKENIGRSEKRTVQDAFHFIRESALYDFTVMRQKNDPQKYKEYLRSPKARTEESKRWKTIRAWIRTGISETDLPEFVSGLNGVKTIDNGILSYSRSEVEEYMWKLDGTPLVSSVGFFGIETETSGFLDDVLYRCEMGYNAVIVDKTEGLRQIDANRKTLLIFSLIIALIAVCMTYIFAGLMVRKIQTISSQAGKVREGDLSISFPEKGMDEISDMGISLNAMLDGLREREEIKGELAAAGEIQKQLLPETIPTTLDTQYSIGRFYMSMQGVGGDYYDFLPLGESRILFCIGDVSNHGVGPAIVMAMLRAHLHGIVRRGESDLLKILHELNRQLYNETPATIFVTFFIGVIDGSTNEVEYCSAGHCKPIVYRHKTDDVEILKGGGLPLGMDDNDIFADTISIMKTKMKPGDLFFQYTDGVSEAMNSKREIFTEERLILQIKKFARKKTEIMIREIALSVQTFTGKDMFSSTGMTELNDDCAMIAFKRLK